MIEYIDEDEDLSDLDSPNDDWEYDDPHDWDDDLEPPNCPPF